MPARPAQKPTAPKKKLAKLEFNNSGAWKLLGTFDTDDDDQVGEVLTHAAALIKALHPDIDPDTASPIQLKRVPTLRVSIEGAACDRQGLLMHWDIRHGWRDAITGEPF